MERLTTDRLSTDRLRDPGAGHALGGEVLPPPPLPRQRPLETARARLFVYDADHLEEIDVPDAARLEEAESIRGFLRDRSDKSASTGSAHRILWADVEGVGDPDALEAIGRAFGLHPLVLEDIANTDQRAKLEDYGDYAYIVARMLVDREEGADPSRPYAENSAHLRRSLIASEQVSLIVGPGFLLSIQESDEHEAAEGEAKRTEPDVFEGTRRRLRQGVGPLRKLGVDYLAYSLLDAIVDHYFAIVEGLGERADMFEDEVITNPSPEVLAEIHVLRRDMVAVRRAVWPLREVLGALSRGEEDLFTETTRVYIRDVVDHAVEVIDTVETLRDTVTGLLDTHLSSMSNRLNEVMKVLTIISTIFMPLTYITGIYGMNFVRLYPNQTTPLGFWLVIGVSLVIALSMLVLFRRRKWI